MLRNFMRKLKPIKPKLARFVQPHEIVESEERDYKKKTAVYQNDSRCPPTYEKPQYHIHKYFGSNTSRHMSKNPTETENQENPKRSV